MTGQITFMREKNIAWAYINQILERCNMVPCTFLCLVVTFEIAEYLECFPFNVV